MSTPAVMHSHSLVQTTVFPSPLRALVSRQYSNREDTLSLKITNLFDLCSKISEKYALHTRRES